MNALKQQALQILVETKISSVLHSLPCNFQKHSGHAYSVYKKPSGECYFSMISPEVFRRFTSVENRLNYFIYFLKSLVIHF